MATSTTATASCAELARLVNQDNNLLTREEAAEYAGVSLPTIDYWMRRGHLPVVRFGRAVRIDVQTLDALMEVRAQSPDGKLPRTPPMAPMSKPGAVTITLTAEQVAQVAALLRVVEGVAK